MKHIKEYSDDELKGLQKDLKSAGYQKPLPHDYLSPDDFFEETIDHDEYVDVSGPSVEMSIDELISDYQERINGIPKQHQGVAGRAIKQLWIEKIENAFR
jgi:DNA-binding ferritin-like protein (Dps family)